MPTTTKGLPYPSNSDNVDVPGDLQALAEAVDTLLPVSGWADKSANYTIVAGDKGSTIRSTNSAITITINNVLTTQGDRIDFIQAGAGQITFAAGSGVTIVSADSYLKTAKQGAAASVVFGGSGVYYLIGQLGA